LKSFVRRLIESGIRSLFKVLGTWLVAQGYADAASWEELALRAIPLIVALVLDWYDKRAASVLQDALVALPANPSEVEVKREIRHIRRRGSFIGG
jgi:hypothetical protein